MFHKLWDLDFRQIDRGAFEADLVQIASPGLQVSKGKFDRKLFGELPSETNRSI